MSDPSDQSVNKSENVLGSDVPATENLVVQQSLDKQKVRVPPQGLYKVQKGNMQYISSAYESLDYDLIENELLIDEEQIKGYKYFVKKNIVKWVVFFHIGLLTAAVASTVDIVIDVFTRKKYITLVTFIEKYQYEKTYIVLLVWMLFNFIPYSLGLVLVTYVEPIAAGSGIPLVKCYLNGVEVPRVLAVKTLIVKATGLACSIVGGVASGKEGPMIHIGACVASLVSRGGIYFFGKNLHLFRYFRDDTEKRDMVSAGAASGVSAAFGASVGGVLFSLEEGASFWNQNLTWRIFFASVISKFIVNNILSAYYGHPGELEHPSLVNMGKCNYKYKVYEIPLFMLMGFLGGLVGAFWNYLNYRLAIIRITIFRRRWIRVVEGSVVSMVTAVIAYVMTYNIKDCGKRAQHKSDYQTKALCEKPDTFNVMASMWLQTPQASVNSLLHDPPNTYSYVSLLTFSLAYYFLSCVTFGLSSSNGIFVPSLLTGASWGRFLARCAHTLFPSAPGKYALIGAAAQLGGMVRMTISLTVIIMETSDNISFSLPIITTLICAKWTGDFFNDGVYAIQVKLKAAPFLPWDPPLLTHGIGARDVMNAPAICIKGIEKVHYLVQLFETTTHNGFPVIDMGENEDISPRFGKIKGIILRSQILVLLMNRMFVETYSQWKHLEKLDTFRDAYLSPHKLSDTNLTPAELRFSIDVRMYMNNSPYTLLESASLPRVFRLFRAIGLRHLPIVNETNEVVGIITRKDLAKFKMTKHRGRLKLESLLIH